MIRFSLVLVFLFSFSLLMAQDDVIVATNTQVQGTYVYQSDVNGKPYYQGPTIFSFYNMEIVWSSDESKWLLRGEVFGSYAFVYSSALDTPFPPDLGWVRGGSTSGSQGSNPVPTFSGGITVLPPDSDAPVITNLSPVDGATDVAWNSAFSITFDELIKKGSGAIRIYRSNGDLHETITEAAFDVSGSTASFSSTGLSSEEDFYILIDNGAILDLFDNAFEITDNTTWNFGSEEVSIMVTGAGDPDFNGTYFGTNISGNALAYENGDYQLRYQTSNGAWIIESQTDVTKGTYLSMAPFPLFQRQPNDIGYESSVEVNGYSATSPAPTLSGNVFNAAFALRNSYPLNGAESFPIANDLELRFNKTIQLGTGLIELYDRNTFALVESFDVTSSTLITVSDKSVLINPTSDLVDGGRYYITAGDNTIQDLTGSPWAGISSYFAFGAISFYAEDGDIVVIGSGWQDFDRALDEFNILNGKPQYSDLEGANIRWEDNVTPNRWILSLYLGANTISYVNYSDTPNPPDTGWQIEAVTGITVPTIPAPGPAPTLSGIVSEYVAPDITPPVMSSLSPSDNATFVEFDQNLIITFDEPVSKGSGNITIYRSDDTVFETINVTDGKVSIDEGTNAIINPDGFFLSTESYYVLIDAGTFTDSKANAFTGLSDITAWSFTSAPLLEVTNAGTTAVNGFYSMVGYESNRPLFTKIGGFTFSSSIQWWPNNDLPGGNWRIQNNGNYYYVSDKDTLSPSTHTWVPESLGEEPTPGASPNPILVYDPLMEFERPTATLTSTVGERTSSSFVVDVVFSEEPRNFSEANIQLTNATIISFSGSGSSFTLEVSPASEGDVEVGLFNITDLIGNPLDYSSYDPVVTFFDTSVPVATISANLGSTTSLTNFYLNILFNEKISGFDPSLLTLTNATYESQEIQGDTLAKVQISVVAPGAITAQLEAGAVMDLVGLSNDQSALFSITYDPLAPIYFQYETDNNEYISDYFISENDEVFAVGNSIPDRSNDFTTVKFSPGGMKDWIEREGGTGTDEAFQIVDYDNHLYVLGAISNASGVSEAAIYKYDYDGNAVDSLISDRSSAFAHTLVIDGFVYESGIKNDIGQRRALSKISLSDFSIEIGEEAIYTTNDVAARDFLYDSINDFIYFHLVDFEATPKQFVVGKYDLSLNKQWVQSFAPTNGAGGLKDMKLNANQDLVLMGHDGVQNLYFVNLSKIDGSTIWETEVTPPNSGFASSNGYLFIVNDDIKYVTDLSSPSPDYDIAMGSLNSLGVSQFLTLTDIGSQQTFNSVNDAMINSQGDLVVVNGYFDNVNTLSVDKFDLADGSLIGNVATYQGAFGDGTGGGKTILKGSYIYTITNSLNNFNRTMEIARFVDADVFNSLPMMNTWLGVVDSDWNNPANWNAGTVPTASDNVQVPASDNDPVISGNALANDLNIDDSASLTIETTGSLIINGAATGMGITTVENDLVGNLGYDVLGSTVGSVDLGLLTPSLAFAYGFDGDDYFIPTTTANGVGYFVAVDGESPTLNFEGTPNSGDISVPIAYIDDALSNDFELLSNPYNAPIYHDAFVLATTGTTDGTIYLWQDGGSNLPSGTRSGNYEVVNSTGLSTGDFDGAINRGQGFFVNAVASGNVNFTTSLHESAAPAMRSSEHQVLKIELSKGTYKDALIISFSDEASSGKDQGLDAVKFLNPAISFYSMLNSEKLAIQALSYEFDHGIDLGYDLLDVGEYHITVDQSPESMSFVLLDQYTGEIYDLTEGMDINVSFTEQSASDRLQIMLKPQAVLSALSSNDDLRVYGHSNELTVEYNVDGVNQVSVHNLSGQVIFLDNLIFINGEALVETTLDKNQVYLLRVNDEYLKFILR